METLPKLTSADLEALPDDGNLYELIEGELYVSKQPSWDHPLVCGWEGFWMNGTREPASES